MAQAAVKKTAVSSSHAEDAIISVKDKHETKAPQSENNDMISVPGAEYDAAPTRFEHRSVKGPKIPPIEIVIYFADKTGLDLMVDDGQHATAGELFEMVMEEMSFPEEARNIFSLWLVSELIELQLKCSHVPFKLVSYWEEVLDKYTEFSAEDEERDEPVIMFQRNVFYPLTDETTLANTVLLKLLYCEALANFLDGRYPLTDDESDRLAGIQAMILERGYDPSRHVGSFYKGRLSEFYPQRLYATKLFSSGRKMDERLAEGHKKAAAKLSPASSPSEQARCQRAFLQQCWRMPFYGAVYFRGQVEHPHSKWALINTADDPVYVAINPRGIFIIDMDNMVLDLGLRYEEVEWQYAQPKNHADRNCLPCLFLQFLMSEEDGARVTKVLQVFSREAFLMDCLIDACVRLKKSAPIGDEIKLHESFEQSMKKLQRLCLTTFDSKGLCLKTEARSTSTKKSISK